MSIFIALIHFGIQQLLQRWKRAATSTPPQAAGEEVAA